LRIEVVDLGLARKIFGKAWRLERSINGEGAQARARAGNVSEIILGQPSPFISTRQEFKNSNNIASSNNLNGAHVVTNLVVLLEFLGLQIRTNKFVTT